MSLRNCLLYITVIVVFACEDKQSDNKENSIQETPTEVKEITETPQKEEEKDTLEFPILTKDTAMDFFLEYQKEHKEDKVRLYTDFGEIDILLYPKTKFHRANFIYLTKRGYFDNTQFYRVINTLWCKQGIQMILK